MKQFRPHPLVWIALALLVLLADYSTGPFIQFPILYLVPVMLAAWFHHRAWAYALAAAMPVCRLYDAVLWHAPWSFAEDATNSGIQIAVLMLVAYFVQRTAREARAMRREVQQLEGLLRICSHCKKIRNDEEAWEPLELFIGRRTEAQFSHGLCPECAQKHYSRYFRAGGQGEHLP